MNDRSNCIEFKDEGLRRRLLQEGNILSKFTISAARICRRTIFSRLLKFNNLRSTIFFFLTSQMFFERKQAKDFMALISAVKPENIYEL